MTLTDWSRDAKGKWFCAPGEKLVAEDRASQVYHAMMVGLRDYVNKNRFPGVVLGLSGGIDSAISAAGGGGCAGRGPRALRDVAVALHLHRKPGRRRCLRRLLGVGYETIEIERAVAAMNETLAGPFAGTQADTTEENLQSRLRGVILMALSNKFGRWC